MRADDLLGGFLSLRMLGGLLAGRAGSRLLLSAAPAVLRLRWEPAEIGRLAAAMGPFIVVAPLVSSGPEKATSKLLPRLSRAGPAAANACLRTALWFGAAGCAWLGVVLATTDADRSATILAFAFTGLLGLGQTVLAVNRATGRAWIDLANQLGLTLGLATGLTVALVTGSLTAMLGIWVVTVALADVVSVVSLGSPILGARPNRVLRRAARTQAVVLSAGDVLAAVAVTAVLMTATALRTGEELADLYTCLGMLTILMAGFSLFLRIIQAPLAARYRTRAGRESRPALETAVLTRSWWVAAYATAVGAALTLAPLTGRHLLVTLVTVAAAAPVLVLVATAHFLFENRDRASLRRTTIGATVGLAATAATMAPLTAALAAPGAVLAILVGDVVHLHWLRAGGARPTAPAER